MEAPDFAGIQFLKPSKGLVDHASHLRMVAQAIEAQYAGEAVKDDLLRLLDVLATAWVLQGSPVERMRVV